MEGPPDEAGAESEVGGAMGGLEVELRGVGMEDDEECCSMS